MGEYIALLITTALVNNVVLVKFLGLCPFMGVSKRIDSALGMGMATTFVIVLAASVCWNVEHYRVLGLFIALIVVNCAVLGRAEAYASRSGVLASACDGLFMGLGFTGALTLIGLIRELIGAGTLFSQASLLLGPRFAFLEITVIPDYGGVLMMILPPAGFLVLGLLLALRRLYELRVAAARKLATPPAEAASAGCH